MDADVGARAGAGAGAGVGTRENARKRESTIMRAQRTETLMNIYDRASVASQNGDAYLRSGEHKKMKR